MLLSENLPDRAGSLSRLEGCSPSMPSAVIRAPRKAPGGFSCEVSGMQTLQKCSSHTWVPELSAACSLLDRTVITSSEGVPMPRLIV